MQLAPDWKLIIHKAWSIRFIVLAALLSGAEAIVSFLPDLLPFLTSGWLALITSFICIGAFIARIVAQKEFPDG